MSEKLLQEPVPPDDGDCCQSGCGDYCVFELYLDEKRAYEEQQRRLKQASVESPI